MGKGRSKALVPVGGSTSALVKNLGMTPAQIKAAAAYLALNRNSNERKLLDHLMRHGGGRLGPIMLRMGLPRDKLLDIWNALKPLSEHGLISEIFPAGTMSAFAKAQSTSISALITREQIRKLERLSPDILASILAAFRSDTI